MTHETKPNSGGRTRLTGSFHTFAHKTSTAVGTPWAAVLAMASTLAAPRHRVG